jgi:hypothetical protein
MAAEERGKASARLKFYLFHSKLAVKGQGVPINVGY